LKQNKKTFLERRSHVFRHTASLAMMFVAKKFRSSHQSIGKMMGPEIFQRGSSGLGV